MSHLRGTAVYNLCHISTLARSSFRREGKMEEGCVQFSQLIGSYQNYRLGINLIIWER